MRRPFEYDWRGNACASATRHAFSRCLSMLPTYHTYDTNNPDSLLHARVQLHRPRKPGVHTNDFAPIYGRRAKKRGHVSLATVFRPGRLKFQPIPRDNLESPILRYQPITTAVINDACLNTKCHHGAYTSSKEDTRWLH